MVNTMKFKIGDKVRYKGKKSVLQDHEGLIIAIDTKSAKSPYQIDFGTVGKWWGGESILELITQECTCDIATLMSTGCQCGSISKYKMEW
jgi:hypothetical protein